MRTYTRLLVATAAAAFMLMAAVGGASANNLSISNTDFRVVWSDEGELSRLLFTDGGTNTARCNVTLEGSFHENTITKTNGALIGHITQALLGPETCEFEGVVVNARILNGRETGTNSLPWHVVYRGYTGTLPTITGINLDLVGAAFILRTSIFGIECLYRSTAAQPARGIAEINEEGTVTGLAADTANTNIPLQSGFGCPGEGTFEGTGLVRLLGTTDVPLTVTLI